MILTSMTSISLPGRHIWWIWLISIFQFFPIMFHQIYLYFETCTAKYSRYKYHLSNLQNENTSYSCWWLAAAVEHAYHTLMDWLIGWLVCYLVDWLINWLLGWLVDWLISWSAGKLVSRSVNRLIDWLINWLVGCLIDWLIDWLIGCIHGLQF